MPGVPARDQAPTVGLVCPRCRSSDLHPFVDADRVNLRCESCRRCWHVELDHVRRVEPAGCRTCGERAACLAAAASRTGDLILS